MKTLIVSETNRAASFLAAALVASALAIHAADAPGETVTISLNSSVKRQTIRGWSCNPFYLEGGREQREQVIDETVNSLGITRLRWHEPGGKKAEADPSLRPQPVPQAEAADREKECQMLPL
jgi:hypothetical protein